MNRPKIVLSAALKATLEYKQRLQYIITMIQEEECDDYEDETIFQLSALENERLIGRRRRKQRLLGYVEEIIPNFCAGEFRSHFRLHPETAESLENRISPLLKRQGPDGRFTVNPRKQLLCVLWLLATPDSYRSIGQKFDLSKSTLHHCFRRVVQALNSIAPNIIHWPASTVEKQFIKDKFQRLAGMPDVVGAIDGCHIEIDAPMDQPAAYRTGKKKYAIQLQAVCTADLSFIDVFAGYPGSVNDARVFRNSPIYHDANQLFSGNDYIIGDKAYPLSVWCISPYKNYGNLTPAHINFNNKLSKSRQVIERAFGLLKGRFRRLKHLVMLRTDQIPYTIMASCVLHNLCLTSSETLEEIEQFIGEGVEVEGDLFETEPESDTNSELPSAAALSKRDYLKDFMF